MINEENYQAFSKFFLDKYFERGFGSMNKTDIEILLFHSLQQFGNIKDKSDFELCRLLKISESKVKRLRYESHIIYGNQTDKDLKVRLYSYLSNARFLKDKGYIQFSIEDKFLRNWFYSKVKEINGFTDTSHNSEIVKISSKIFADVLQELYKVKECYKRFVEQGEDVGELNRLGFDSVNDFKEKIEQGTASFKNIVELLKLFSTIPVLA